ncbi:hypothetical protein E2C01_041459 [Portunus trituberculatus]|uniref:Uncharacterized protein n=1 Tax=Portunus trituberculatus TaxID=210409 RepID=A0A5B7FQP4_PORTR|nr:hypothetical protein [Portunus trituberculatus]
MQQAACASVLGVESVASSRGDLSVRSSRASWGQAEQDALKCVQRFSPLIPSSVPPDPQHSTPYPTKRPTVAPLYPLKPHLRLAYVPSSCFALQIALGCTETVNQGEN